MGPTDREFDEARAEEERRQARVDAALQAGWVIRFDWMRLEYTATRELHVGRTLGELLAKIEGA